MNDTPIPNDNQLRDDPPPTPPVEPDPGDCCGNGCDPCIFDLHDLARSRPEVAGSDWVPPSYLDTGASRDSPWSEQWGRMSLGELRQQLEGFMKR